MLHNLLVHIESFASAHAVHVYFGTIRWVCLFAKMCDLLLGGWYPEWINVDYLKRELNVSHLCVCVGLVLNAYKQATMGLSENLQWFWHCVACGAEGDW